MSSVACRGLRKGSATLCSPSLLGQCPCGMNMKVMYERDGKTKVRCPNSFCKIIHTVGGKITELWS